MDPLSTINPKSMKERYCFDPSKIPSGFKDEGVGPVKQLFKYNKEKQGNSFIYKKE